MLFPKINSGFDENMIEGLWMNCVVIASNSGAAIEIIGNHG